MTLTQLSTFLAIVENGSFTAAANQLGYAQSTVTTQIKQLEEELNCLLFERLGKSLNLTAEGRRLIEYAGKMLQIEREIKCNAALYSRQKKHFIFDSINTITEHSFR